MTPDEFAKAMGAQNLGTFEEIVSVLTPEQRVKLAEGFEVAPSTVDGWADGTANPHSVLKWQIVRWIGRFLPEPKNP